VDFPRTKQYSILVYWVGWDENKKKSKVAARQRKEDSIEDNTTRRQNYREHTHKDK
jgi:hypothetical protein